MKLGNMNILDVVVNLVHKNSARQNQENDSPICPDVDGEHILLADANGVLLKSNDGYYLAANKT